METTKTFTTSKVVTCVAVLALAMVALTGAIYAYNAIYNDNIDGKDVDEEYVYFTGTKYVPNMTVDAVWDTSAIYVKTGEKTYTLTTTYKNGHFVQDLGAAGVKKITELTYDLGTITVKKHTAGSDVAVTDLTAAMCTVTLSDIESGKTAAVAKDEQQKYSVSVVLDDTNKASGEYGVKIVYTLITLPGSDSTGVTTAPANDYVIPATTFSITYTVAEPQA